MSRRTIWQFFTLVWGDKDRALEQLNKAYEDRAGFIIYLNVEPLFDPLRSNPRFTELVRKMKFQS